MPSAPGPGESPVSARHTSRSSSQAAALMRHPSQVLTNCRDFIPRPLNGVPQRAITRPRHRTVPRAASVAADRSAKACVPARARGLLTLLGFRRWWQIGVDLAGEVPVQNLAQALRWSTVAARPAVSGNPQFRRRGWGRVVEAGVGPGTSRRWCRHPTQIVRLGLALLTHLVLGPDLAEPKLPERGLDLLDELIGQVKTGMLRHQRAEID